MDQLRAAFVVFHLVAITLLSIPAPVGGMTEASFADPDIVAAFEGWTGTLNSVGVDWTVEETRDRAWRWGNGFMDARATVLAPFRPYHKYTGTHQGWRMFGYVNRKPAYLRIELRRDGVWTPIYEARSDAATWQRRLMDSERFRAFINDFSWLRNRRDYRRFAEWVAVRAAADFPDADAVRLTMQQRTTPAPQVLARDGFPPAKPRWTQVVSVPAPEGASR